MENPAPAHAVLLINDMPCPLTAADIAMYSTKDFVISIVLDWVRRGWPQGTVGEEFRPFKVRMTE